MVEVTGEEAGLDVYKRQAQGDVIGSVALLGDGQAAQQPGETEIKRVTVAAAFLGRQMEE